MFEATHFCRLPGKASVLLAGMIIALTVACGSDAGASTSAGQESQPAQQVAAAPEPTATQPPEPTATQQPEPTTAPTAKPEKDPAIVFESDYNSNGLVRIDLPTELNPASDRLSEAEVESLWTKTIANARHFVSDGSVVIDTCADGTGIYLVDFTLAGETFTWEVKKDPAGRWSSAAARLEFLNPDIGYGWAAGNRIPLEINSDGEREWGTYAKSFIVNTFVSPDC